MSRTNIEIDDSLMDKARKLTRLKTKRQIVDKALDVWFVPRAVRESFAPTEAKFGRATLRDRGEIVFDPGG